MNTKDTKTQFQFEKNNRPLAGKVALVTGASRGIGKAIALELAREGANVSVIARDKESLERVKREIDRLSPQSSSLAISCDLSKPNSLESAISDVEKKLATVSILVNNCGIYKTQEVRDHSLSVWSEIIDTNLTSALRAARSVLDGMIQQGWGRIINISSISGKQGEAYGAAYSATKFGLIGLTQSLALEVATKGITVNAVCPGWVDTDMAQNQLHDEEWCKLNNIDPTQSKEIARLSIPQQRFVEPEEVASLVAYLCSEKARSITGQAVNICGGLSLSS